MHGPAGVYLGMWWSRSRSFHKNDYVQVRHTSANPSGTAETKLIVSGVAYPFRTSTGNAAFACNLDLNGDNVLDALTEGLVLIRAMFGLTGTSVTQGTGITSLRGIRSGCTLTAIAGPIFED